MLTHEKSAGGETIERVSRDVHRGGPTVEDELGQALADRRCGLEPGSREPAREVEALRPRLAEDAVLVRGDPVLAAVARPQRPIGHPRHAGTHSADHLLDELGAGP